MKKIWKITALLCVLAALFCLCSFEGEAGFKVDNQWGDAPLTEADVAALTALAAGQTDKVGNTDFLVVFASDWESTAKEELRDNGYSSRRQNVIGLVVWHNGTRYETELYTYGDMSRYITDAEIQTLKSEVDADAKAGRMYGAVETLIVRSTEMLAAGKAANPPRTQKVWLSLILGLVAGAVSGGVAVLIVVLRYRKKNRSASYPLEQFANLTLTLERDMFLYNTVTKTAIPTSTGGRSGGGGGHSGGGGRSSGRS